MGCYQAHETLNYLLIPASLVPLSPENLWDCKRCLPKTRLPGKQLYLMSNSPLCGNLAEEDRLANSGHMMHTHFTEGKTEAQ